MIQTQKIIKYCAIAFALFLTYSIISSIMFGIISIGNIFALSNNDNHITKDLKDITVINDIQKLDIKVKSINIIIREGTTLKIETNNEHINIKENNNKLSIIEEKYNLINNTDSLLIIYIPNEYIFETVSIENGAGKIEIDNISSEKLNLDLGAGKVDIQNITILKETEIEGGAGEITITNGSINNLDLDMGVGNLTLASSLNGNNEIDAGVGTIKLNLIGSSKDYKIKINKGIGTSTLEEEKMKNDIYYGTGSNLINVDGGIGNININYSK